MISAAAKKKITVLTGAGISQESGIKTFRDGDGLWENYKITEVCTPEGFYRNPQLVLDFYNARRRELQKVKPNAAHYALKDLEELFAVTVITQNIDNLHERAGSSNILHLHGELIKARGVNADYEILDWQGDLTLADKDRFGNALRPHIVWFGEDVPNIIPAQELTRSADILLIIGTSLQVYPAAGLYHYARSTIPVYLVDPHPAAVSGIEIITATAAAGVPLLVKKLLWQEKERQEKAGKN